MRHEVGIPLFQGFLWEAPMPLCGALPTAQPSIRKEPGSNAPGSLLQYGLDISNEDGVCHITSSHLQMDWHFCSSICQLRFLMINLQSHTTISGNMTCDRLVELQKLSTVAAEIEQLGTVASQLTVS